MRVFLRNKLKLLFWVMSTFFVPLLSQNPMPLPFKEKVLSSSLGWPTNYLNAKPIVGYKNYVILSKMVVVTIFLHGLLGKQLEPI